MARVKTTGLNEKPFTVINSVLMGEHTMGCGFFPEDLVPQDNDKKDRKVFGIARGTSL